MLTELKPRDLLPNGVPYMLGHKTNVSDVGGETKLANFRGRPQHCPLDEAPIES